MFMLFANVDRIERIIQISMCSTYFLSAFLFFSLWDYVLHWATLFFPTVQKHASLFQHINVIQNRNIIVIVILLQKIVMFAILLAV